MSAQVESLETPHNFAAWWPFDEDANDTTGNYNGTIHGGQIVEDAVRDRVLQIDSNPQKVVTPHDTDNLTSFSVSSWFYMEPTQSRFSTIVAEAGYNGKVVGWTLRLSNGKITAAIGDGDHQTVLTVISVKEAITAWHHLVLTYDGTTAAVYFDGHLVDSAPAAFRDAKGTTSVGWSSLNSGESYFNGRIDDVVIYHRALDIEEITAMSAHCGNNSCENNEPATALLIVARQLCVVILPTVLSSTSLQMVSGIFPMRPAPSYMGASR